MPLRIEAERIASIIEESMWNPQELLEKWSSSRVSSSYLKIKGQELELLAFLIRDQDKRKDLKKMLEIWASIFAEKKHESLIPLFCRLHFLIHSEILPSKHAYGPLHENTLKKCLRVSDKSLVITGVKKGAELSVSASVKSSNILKVPYSPQSIFVLNNSSGYFYEVKKSKDFHLAVISDPNSEKKVIVESLQSLFFDICEKEKSNSIHFYGRFQFEENCPSQRSLPARKSDSQLQREFSQRNQLYEEDTEVTKVKTSGYDFSHGFALGLAMEKAKNIAEDEIALNYRGGFSSQFYFADPRSSLKLLLDFVFPFEYKTSRNFHRYNQDVFRRQTSLDSALFFLYKASSNSVLSFYTGIGAALDITLKSEYHSFNKRVYNLSDNSYLNGRPELFLKFSFKEFKDPFNLNFRLSVDKLVGNLEWQFL